MRYVNTPITTQVGKVSSGNSNGCERLTSGSTAAPFTNVPWDGLPIATSANVNN